jgi:nucleotide-binding universal stress UspA family protein
MPAIRSWAGWTREVIVQMRARLICGVDDSEPARDATHVATDLSERLGLELVLAHVISRAAVGRRPAPEELRPARQAGFDALKRAAGGETVRQRAAVAMEVGDPAEVLVRLADDDRTALVVVGSRGRGALRGAILGSVSASVFRKAAAPVLVVPPRASEGFQAARTSADPCLLFGIEDSQGSWRALEYASELAERLGARLHVLHVFPPPHVSAVGLHVGHETAALESRRRAANRMGGRVAELVGDRVDARFASGPGAPAMELERAGSQLGAELIVIGSRGDSALRACLRGSVSAKLASSASRPVLIVPHGFRAKLDPYAAAANGAG